MAKKQSKRKIKLRKLSHFIPKTVFNPDETSQKMILLNTLLRTELQYTYTGRDPLYNLIRSIIVKDNHLLLNIEDDDDLHFMQQLQEGCPLFDQLRKYYKLYFYHPETDNEVFINSIEEGESKLRRILDELEEEEDEDDDYDEDDDIQRELDGYPITYEDEEDDDDYDEEDDD